jgi:hypothetical protein
MAARMDGGLPSGSRRFAVPISRFQSDVLRSLAAQRSPDSYIAGGVAINREGPRFSGDIDIFHDSEARLESAAKADTAALTAAGYSVTWERVREGKREATVARRGEEMPLEWVTDAAFRFFPTQPDELFGYVLHPVDLATNKASAAADRRVPRDIVDLVTIHETILPLGAVLCAAVGIAAVKAWPAEPGVCEFDGATASLDRGCARCHGATAGRDEETVLRSNQETEQKAKTMRNKK